MSSDNNDKKFFDSPEDVQAYYEWCETQAICMAYLRVGFMLLYALRNGDNE